MKIRKSGEQIVEEDIIRLENELEIELPQEYKEFLFQNNGGYVDGFLCTPNFDEIHPETYEVFVQSVNPDKFYSLEEVREEYEDNEDDPVFPRKLIPIGYDSAGNKILLGVDEAEDYGCVFFANHEWYVSKTGFYVITKIANSFDEFVSILHPYEE
jgi:hypothetical protein